MELTLRLVVLTARTTCISIQHITERKTVTAEATAFRSINSISIICFKMNHFFWIWLHPDRDSNPL